MNERPLVLVREPAASLAEGIVTHIQRSAIDVERARGQWQAYVQVWRDLGWGIHEVARRDDLPDSVFIEDAIVVFGDVAVITRPGADARKPETAAAEQTARDLGDDRFVRNAIAAVGGPSVFGIADNFERSEEFAV